MPLRQTVYRREGDAGRYGAGCFSFHLGEQETDQRTGFNQELFIDLRAQPLSQLPAPAYHGIGGAVDAEEYPHLCRKQRRLLYPDRVAGATG